MHQTATHSRLFALSLAALGIVYGDIGTSPLYALKEVFSGAHHPVPLAPDNVFGVLSLIFWSLMIVVTLKYVVFIMRVDNKGEGGVMALMALVLSHARGRPHAKHLMLLGLFGAALFYGDGVITPAISVLSAMEGLEVATPKLKPYVIPLTLAVIVALFMVQKSGTGRVGKFFGPIVLLWFAVLALLGVKGILSHPHVLTAVNPIYAVRFFQQHHGLGFLALGAVVLAVTGAEALYADMGHFGRKPVQLAWSFIVLPALLLNYFGQGALLIENPQAIANPFYLLAPSWALYPMVFLAAAATVIASQAVISGVFSLTHQAMQLGYVPRMELLHTSHRQQGQIYMPGINRALCWAVILLVLFAGSSSRLASAYGIAVTGTMVITTILTFFVVRYEWGWSKLKSGVVLGALLSIDVAFFLANIAKISDGGWIPLSIGFALFFMMTTWKNGQIQLRQILTRDAFPLKLFAESVAHDTIVTVPGTAVFLTAHPETVPHALLHSLKHYKCLHEKVVVLTVVSSDDPHVPPDQRVSIERINDQFYMVRVLQGFTDTTNLTELLTNASQPELPFDLMNTSYFLGRETVVPSRKGAIARLRESVFRTMFRNADSAATYFRLPPNRVVEVGTQIEL